MAVAILLFVRATVTLMYSISFHTTKLQLWIFSKVTDTIVQPPCAVCKSMAISTLILVKFFF